MRRTVPVAPDFEIAFPGLTYGLGLMREPPSCGGYRWGHGGDLPGATIRDGVTEDGQRSIVINASGKTDDDEQSLVAEAALRQPMDTALCRGRGEAAPDGPGRRSGRCGRARLRRPAGRGRHAGVRPRRRRALRRGHGD